MRVGQFSYKKNIFYILFLLLSFCVQDCFFPQNTYAAVDEKRLNEANKLYKQGEFDQALEFYNEALLKAQDSHLLNFNTADAYYKKGNYEKAKELFSRALSTQNKGLESKAAYNIGNSLFKQAQAKQKSGLSESLDLLNESLTYYQRAIELDQKDQDAKFNYELTAAKLEKLKKDLEKQRQEQHQEQQEQRQKQNEAQKEQSPSSQSQLQQEAKSEAAGQNNEKQKEAEKKQSLEAKKEDKETQKESEKKGQVGRAQKEADEMTQDEAKMLIDAYSREGLRLNLSDLHEPREDPG